MTTEEKAKRYDEALEKAKESLKDGGISQNSIDYIQSIFPELAESEDERIRKVLIDLVKCNERSGYTLLNNVSTSSMLTWLEKQGEQKNKINSYKPTFEDVLALECAIKTVRITEGGNELYEMLVSLHNKIYNAYLDEKQGEQAQTKEIKGNEGKISLIDGFDSELNALLKKYEHLSKKELQEPLEFYLGIVRDDLDVVRENPTKHEGWVNIFKCGLCYSVWGNIYPTKEDAINDIEGDEGDVYITTIKIEWEE